jgi:hypothetical protein
MGLFAKALWALLKLVAAGALACFLLVLAVRLIVVVVEFGWGLV